MSFVRSHYFSKVFYSASIFLVLSALPAPVFADRELGHIFWQVIDPWKDGKPWGKFGNASVPGFPVLRSLP